MKKVMILLVVAIMGLWLGVTCSSQKTRTMEEWTYDECYERYVLEKVTKEEIDGIFNETIIWKHLPNNELIVECKKSII